MKYLLSIICIFFFHFSFAQSPTVVVTGQTVDAETFDVLPFVNVKIKGKNRGSAANELGEFTLNASPGDTLEFTEVGYMSSLFFIPTKAEKSYDIIKLMRKDTVMLREIIISTMPSEDRFKEIFLAHSKDQNEVAMKKGYQAFFVTFRQQQGIFDKQLGGQYFQQVTGMDPVNDWINPVRWVQFVNDVKSGKFKDALPVTDIDWIEKD